GWNLPIEPLPLVVNTALGMSFIGAANTSVEYGHQEIMSAKVRLPMMWRPAWEIASSVHCLAPASGCANTQFASPLGPQTNPSAVMDIFRISLRIGGSICCLSAQGRTGASRIDMSLAVFVDMGRGGFKASPRRRST